MTLRLILLALVPFLMASSGCGTYGSAAYGDEAADSPSGSETMPAQTDTTLTLSLKGSENLAGHSIVFQEIVEDSRCPKGVDCVWEGKVVVALKIDGERVELSNHGRDENHTYALDDGVLTLKTVNPYPDQDNPSDEEPTAVVEWEQGTKGDG